MADFHKCKDLSAFAEVEGDPGEYLSRLHKALADSGIDLRYSNQMGSAVGLSRGGCIEVKQGLAEAEDFAVLVHEWAHDILHHQKGVGHQSKTVLETEAEAVSFVVSKEVGLGTNTDSIDYIQLYNGKKETLMESPDAYLNFYHGGREALNRPTLSCGKRRSK